MADTNVVVVKGNLTRDSELKYTTTGKPMLKFSIANNVGYGTEQGWKEYTNFFDCTMWGKRTESVQQYLTKGAPVIVTGELRQSSGSRTATSAAE